MIGPSEGEVPEWPHKPAPPEPVRLLPEWPLLSRGLALGATATVILTAAVVALRLGPLTGFSVAPALTLAAGLFAWAATVHLTGGEKFDDHRWV